MIFSRNLMSAAIAAFATGAVLAPPAAHAQNRSVTQGRSGPFAIDYVIENGQFDRCAATLSPGPNMLRIAYTRNLAYSISVPGVPVPARTITFLFGPRPWVKTPATDPKRVRAWAAVGTDTIEALMKVKDKIAIDLGDKQYRWPIGRTDMTAVMVALENCTHKALGH